MRRELKIFAAMLGVFVFAYWIPLSNPKIQNAIQEAFKLLQWYARNHTLACVVPALFIAGGIMTFLSQASVMRYLGPNSNKVAAYTVASVSGTVLAVCSCSVLPMFAGIYRLGAGLGPASARTVYEATMRLYEQILAERPQDSACLLALARLRLQQGDGLALMQRARLDAADRDPADVLGPVERGDQHLQRRVRLDLRAGDFL